LSYTSVCKSQLHLSQLWCFVTQTKILILIAIDAHENIPRPWILECRKRNENIDQSNSVKWI